MLALLGGAVKAAGTANKVRSATKILPDRNQSKKSSALATRPKTNQFAKQAEEVKNTKPTQALIPSIDSFSKSDKSDSPKKEGNKKSLKETKKKIDTIFEFIKTRSKAKEKLRNQERKRSEKKERKDKEKNKEKGIASKLVKGAKNKILAPAKSVFDSILSIIGNIIIAKIGMWAIDNPELFANILKGLAAAAEFITDAFIKIVDIFAGLIEFGYGLVDGFNDWIEGTFGKDVAKVLDDLGPTILAFLNAAFAVGTALLALKALKPKDQDNDKGKKAKGKTRPRTPGQGPDPDINLRKRGGITISGGKRKGLRGFFDKISDANPLRKRPPVTGADDFFSKSSRKINQLNPLSGGAKSVTVSGGGRTGLGGIQDAIADTFKKKPEITTGGSGGKKRGFFDKLNPFNQTKPKITGSGAPPSFMDRLKNIGSGALDLGRKGVKKLEEGTEILLEKGGRFGRFISEQYKKVTAGLSEWAEKNSPKLTAVLEYLGKGKGVLSRVAKGTNSLLKKFGKYIPFIGDAYGFGMDLIGGVDWRRALIRAVTGAGIDAGFAALMGALGLAAPFTGGASGVLATTIFLAYMGADIASGGFGRILGDKISDAFGIPMMAGEKPIAEPKLAGNDSDVKKLQEAMKKKAEENPEFAKKIGAISTTTSKVTKPVTPKPTVTSKPEPPKVQPKTPLIPTSSSTPSSTPSATVAGSEMDLFQRLVLAESGGEGELGMALVARSVMNRAGLIQSGKVGPGMFMANDETITGVIMGKGQYQPVSDGSINTQRSDAQMAKAASAIELAKDVNQLKTKLASSSMSESDINKLLGATGFRTGAAFNDPSQNVNVVKFKNHYFNTAGNSGLKATNAKISDDVSKPGTSPPPPLLPAQISSEQRPSSPSASSVPTLSSSSTSQSSAVSKPTGGQVMVPIPTLVGKNTSMDSSRMISSGSPSKYAMAYSYYIQELSAFLYKQG